MATTKTSICNQALSLIGSPAISDINDVDTRETRLLSTNYDPLKTTLLSVIDWGFCRVSRPLGEITYTEKNGFSHAYSYPNDCVLIREIMDSSGKESEYQTAIDFITNDTIILTNTPNAVCLFSYNVQLEYNFPNHFVECLAFLLAERISFTLTNKGSLTNQLLQRYRLALSEALRIETSQSYKTLPMSSDQLNDARFS